MGPKGEPSRPKWAPVGPSGTQVDPSGVQGIVWCLADLLVPGCLAAGDRGPRTAASQRVLDRGPRLLRVTADRGPRFLWVTADRGPRRPRSWTAVALEKERLHEIDKTT